MTSAADTLCIDTGPDGAIVLAGEMDSASASSLHIALKWSLADQPHYLILDVSALNFCDSSGLAVLAQARGLLPDTSPLILRGATPQLRRLLHITGLDNTFTLT